jgi:hypothetical protein
MTPLAKTPTTFDNSAMAMTAFEDTYLTIRDIDGPDWVDTLRTRMFDKNDTERLTTEQSWLLATVV